ncbi:MAG: nitroreductase [Proteobacteria bacterium]|nr:nitroreductase [Pseudomonadota bacterium]
MNVTEAVRSRAACRAFLDRPVPAAVLRTLVETALRAPSGGNLQPWHVHVLTGAAKARLTASVMEAFQRTPAGEPDHDPQIYPEPLGEPYKTRRAVCGAMLYDALKIPREDKMGRIRQALKNYEFFGAPVGLIFTAPAGMVEGQAVDMGILMQTVMLLAREQGLDTCPQAIWRMWPKAIAAALGLGEGIHVLGGMSLGYADAASPVATLNIPRDGLDVLATFHSE